MTYLEQRQQLKLTGKPIAKVSKGVPKEIKVKKEIAKVSPKMKIIKAELKRQYPLFLAANPLCGIKSPVCTVQATCAHRLQGRGVNEILDQSKWMASCAMCNLWVEEKHSEAEAKGFKLSRHKK